MSNPEEMQSLHTLLLTQIRDSLQQQNRHAEQQQGAFALLAKKVDGLGKYFAQMQQQLQEANNKLEQLRQHGQQQNTWLSQTVDTALEDLWSHLTGIQEKLGHMQGFGENNASWLENVASPNLVKLQAELQNITEQVAKMQQQGEQRNEWLQKTETNYLAPQLAQKTQELQWQENQKEVLEKQALQQAKQLQEEAAWRSALESQIKQFAKEVDERHVALEKLTSAQYSTTQKAAHEQQQANSVPFVEYKGIWNYLDFVAGTTEQQILHTKGAWIKIRAIGYESPNAKFERTAWVNSHAPQQAWMVDTYQQILLDKAAGKEEAKEVK